MAQSKLNIEWSKKAKSDLKKIYCFLLEKNSEENTLKIINELAIAPSLIIFPEQFQLEENSNGCRRIIIRNYKILYYNNQRIITIIGVFNTYRHPSKMLLDI